jgi:hypothetical protein
MQAQQPLRGDDLQALRAEPPRNAHGQLVPWTLGHRLLADHRLDQAVEHRGLTLHDSTFRGFTWSGAAGYSVIPTARPPGRRSRMRGFEA